MDFLDSEWQRKGSTLSEKTTREEFGLTQDEIVQAIRAGKLRYRVNSMYGNPSAAHCIAGGRLAAAFCEHHTLCRHKFTFLGKIL